MNALKLLKRKFLIRLMMALGFGGMTAFCVSSCQSLSSSSHKQTAHEIAKPSSPAPAAAETRKPQAPVPTKAEPDIKQTAQEIAKPSSPAPAAAETREPQAPVPTKAEPDIQAVPESEQAEQDKPTPASESQLIVTKYGTKPPLPQDVIENMAEIAVPATPELNKQRLEEQGQEEEQKYPEPEYTTKKYGPPPKKYGPSSGL